MSEPNFSNIEKELSKYDSFVDKLNSVVGSYIDEFPDLKLRIAELRANKPAPKTKVPTNLNFTESVLEDATTLHAVKAVWKKLAQLTHPDLGGDPLIFMYARCLYKSNDLISLNHLYDAVRTGNFRDYQKFILTKLRAMYEVLKSKPSYQILLLDQRGDHVAAKRATESYLKRTIQNLTFS